MQSLSIGKLRGLQQCSSDRGTFTALALDHRQNLRRALNPSDPASIMDEDLTHFKLELTAALASQATAVLLDPEYSAAQALASGLVPNHVGLVVALESTGYTGDTTARHAQILPGWSVEKAKHMGADAVKLLVYYHPEASTASEIESFVKQVAGECIRYDLALMLEPLAYPLEAGRKSLSSKEKRHVVVETARSLTPLGVDILKAEFPLDTTEEKDEIEWAKACAEISSASCVPWLLLSAAADYEIYLRQVSIACKAGASGIAVGRAVWQEAVALSGAARTAFLNDVACQRLGRLTALCAELGKPWTDIHAAPLVTPNWFSSYNKP
jgi:tagatose-1,6-bisphosphate aldolase